MESLEERKQKLFFIIDGYVALLGRQDSNENKNRKEELLAQKGAIQWDRYQIALIGHGNRGKSTLLNAMLGEPGNFNLSPVSARSTTAAIVKYIDWDLHPDGPGIEGAIVYFNDSDAEPLRIKKSELPPYVDQKADGFTEERAKRIDRIEVYGNFPLIKNRGVFVDTPGMGALLDQNYLAENILSEVDIILCPISAKLPLTMDEELFLRNLHAHNKRKLVYMLTMVDMLSKEDLVKVISVIQDKTSSISGGMSQIYQVAARKVLDAFEEGKSQTEIEQEKKDSGIKALENALDIKLRKKSSPQDRMRAVCKMLEDWFKNDADRFTEMKETFNLEVKDLEARKKELSTVCQNVKAKLNSSSKKLEKQWASALKRFVARLETSKFKITEQLSSGVQRENLITLIGYSSKLAREIQSLLQSQLQADLADLKDKLENIVTEFAKELESEIIDEIDVYGGSYANSSLKGEIKTLIGGGIVTGGAVFGATTVAGALTSISTAATGLSIAVSEASTATTIATATAAKAGFFTKVWVALFGAGKTSAIATTGAAATAAAAAVPTAQSTLVAALIGGVVPILGGVAVATLAYRIGTSFAKNQAVKNIPDMVDAQIKEAVASIEYASDKMLAYALDYFRDHLETTLNRAQEELDAAIERHGAIEAQTKEIEQNRQELGKLSTDLIRFMNVMNTVGD